MLEFDEKKLLIDTLTRQHETYAELTANALKFPINLVLSVNTGAIASILLLTRNLTNEELAQLKITSFSLSSPILFFGAGLVAVLAATFWQWRTYEYITGRKRRVLKRALAADDLNVAINEFIAEPSTHGKTNSATYCFIAVVLSFLFFLIGSLNAYDSLINL